MPRNLHVVHLEDHAIYQRGMQQSLMRQNNGFMFHSFGHPVAALHHIKTALDNHIKIDLIITDFTQKTANGYLFACTVRKLEAATKQRIPILLLSLLEPEIKPLLAQGLAETLFDAYLPKCAEPEEIMDAIHTLVQQRGYA